MMFCLWNHTILLLERTNDHLIEAFNFTYMDIKKQKGKVISPVAHNYYCDSK